MRTSSVARLLVSSSVLWGVVGCGRLNFGAEPDAGMGPPDTDGVGVVDQSFVMDAESIDADVIVDEVALDVGIVMIRRDGGMGDAGVTSYSSQMPSDQGTSHIILDSGDGIALPPPPPKSGCLGFELDSESCWDGVVPSGASWSRQVIPPVNTNVEAEYYIVDLFSTPQVVINQLHDNGRRVICNFNAGARESWRPDANEFTTADFAQGEIASPGMTRLNTNSANVRRIMTDRVRLAAAKQCDGVEPDDIDASVGGGSVLTRADRLDYGVFLAGVAHLSRLSVGLANALDLVSVLETDFDWASNESCLVYDECHGYRDFLDSGKAVLHTEYASDFLWTEDLWSYVCDAPSLAGFSTVISQGDFSGWYLTCP